MYQDQAVSKCYIKSFLNDQKLPNLTLINYFVIVKFNIFPSMHTENTAWPTLGMMIGEVAFHSFLPLTVNFETTKCR